MKIPKIEWKLNGKDDYSFLSNDYYLRVYKTNTKQWSVNVFYKDLQLTTELDSAATEEIAMLRAELAFARHFADNVENKNTFYVVDRIALFTVVSSAPGNLISGIALKEKLESTLKELNLTAEYLKHIQ